MFKFLKKDNFWMGLLIGLLIPAATYALLHFLNLAFKSPAAGRPMFRESTLQIIGLVPSAILLRYYLVKLKADKTGKGILFITFVLAIAFFINYLD